MRFVRPALAAAASLLVTLSAGAQPRVGDSAPDFPVGLFSDGNEYKLSDLRGRAVVLFFYESQCPRCRESIPERNAVMKAFEDRPDDPEYLTLEERLVSELERAVTAAFSRPFLLAALLAIAALVPIVLSRREVSV